MTYKVELTQSDEGYSVACPELPGCASQGETEQEAIANIREAISDYLSAAPRSGMLKEIRFVEVPEQKASSSKPDRIPFKVHPFDLNLPKEWTSHKVEDLLDILEGPDRHW